MGLKIPFCCTSIYINGVVYDTGHAECLFLEAYLVDHGIVNTGEHGAIGGAVEIFPEILP